MTSRVLSDAVESDVGEAKRQQQLVTNVRLWGRRRGRRLLLMVSPLVLCCLAGSAPAERSLSDLTGSWQLLVDDWLVATRQDVQRTWHPFEKHAANPVLTADKPWEGAICYVYGTVLPGEDGRGYRMWYHSWAEREYRKLYATSADGLAWNKPELGQVDFRGSTKNNMFLKRTREDHSPQVLHTPGDPDPQKRYKLITYEYGRTPPQYTISGYLGAYSPDGIHWTESPQYPILPDHGDVGNFIWDPLHERLIGYPKKFTQVRGFRRRCVGFSETTQFDAWPAARLVLIPDEFDDRWVTTAEQHTDFYGLSAFPYESMYLGFLWVFPITDGKKDGPIFVEMVTSRDGVNWQRQDQPRTPVLPTGPQGSWDSGMVFTPNHPLVEGDRIRLYYGGFSSTHGADGQAGIGLASLRKDGFASLDAGATEGAITTRPLAGIELPLRVNADASKGSILVEVLDDTGQPLPGFTRTDCLALTSDSVDQPVTWKGSLRLPAGPLQLRFVLRNASLYSFHAGDRLQVFQPDRGILYTAEGDEAEGHTDGTVSDRLAADGTQPGRLPGSVAIDTASPSAAFSQASLRFPETTSERAAIVMPHTSQPGTSFTLAAVIKPTSTGLTRLFSNYRGSGTPWTSELIVDVDPSGKSVRGMRAVINGVGVQSNPITIRSDRFHHVAITYENGNVGLFLDGHEAGRGSVPAGPVLLGTDLQFGEDTGGVVNEQFTGVVDDILFLRRSLSPDEIESLATRGAQAFLDSVEPQPEPVRVHRKLIPRPPG